MSSSGITPVQMQIVISDTCDVIEENRIYLSDLDGAIGDGDHGISMAKAFGAVKDRLPEWQDQDISGLLRNVGFTLTNAVGGAMGPLYGTFFLRQSQVTVGKDEIDLPTLVAMFQASEQGIRDIGQAQPGDKTLLDTLVPAVRSLEMAQQAGKSLPDALADFDKAAEQGWRSTRDMLAKTGRASRLGERTIGHLDPGATSCYLILHQYAQVAAPPR